MEPTTVPIFSAFEYLLITIAAIFVIVNPLTTAFVFMSLLPRANDARRKDTAKRAVMVSTGIFFLFAVLGGVIFQLFGITIEAFRIAGGIILFGIAMGMIRKGRDEGEEIAEDGPETTQAGQSNDVAIIPLAIPFISGPGSIATVMILTSEAPTPLHVGIVFLAILITTVTTYYAMIHSKILVRYLGDTGKDIVTKLVGLILSVIAVQFVINGVSDVYRKLPEREASTAMVDQDKNGNAQNDGVGDAGSAPVP